MFSCGKGALHRSAARTLLALVGAIASGYAGQAVAQDPRAEEAALEEIVVTGHRESAANAQAIKRSAIQVVDSIVASHTSLQPYLRVRLPGQLLVSESRRSLMKVIRVTRPDGRSVNPATALVPALLFLGTAGTDTHNFASTIISRTFALGLQYSF